MEELVLIREIDGKKYPEIKSLISDIPIPDKARVVQYMKRAKVLAIAPGRVKDVLTGEPLKGTLCTQTDGEYIWRSDIVYYFEKYNLQLPEKFTAKAIKAAEK